MSVSAGAAHETEAPGGPARGLLGRTSATLRMIKVSHTVFAMPFALAALLLATDGRPTPWVLSWVVVALVGARSAGMAFNRLVDVRFDAANPRTRGRELPSDKLGRNFVRGFVLVACGVFVLAAGMLNPLCLALSPLALAVVLGYSFAKRFTAASHLWLGVALGISPVCAWLAVTGRFDESLWIPAPFSAAVLLWVAGFDLIYACQDADFDRSAGLHSVPARFGVPVALRLSAL